MKNVTKNFLTLKKKQFVNKLMLITLLMPSLVLSKEYTLVITPCDRGSNCKKCYEQVELTYKIDEKLMTVTLIALDEKGSLIQETSKECFVGSTNDWWCSGVFMSVASKNAELRIFNNPKSSLASSGKELCMAR